MQFPKRTIRCHKPTKKGRSIKERPGGVSAGITYLQFVQVQVEPQLQFAQVQFGLPHFTF
jgi:hypothetical protein